METPVRKYQKLGNIPPIAGAVYYRPEDNKGKKPTLTLTEGHRACYIKFKLNKKDGPEKNEHSLRDSIAVQVPDFSIAKVRDVERGSDFLLSLLRDHQDSNAAAVANGDADWKIVTDVGAMVADYFDNSKGPRMTAEQIGAWFDADFAAWLSARVTAKFPQFPAEKIAAIVAQYRASFVELHKFQLPHTEPVWKQLNVVWTDWLAELGEVSEAAEMLEWVAGRMTKLQVRYTEAQTMMLEAV